MFLRNSMASIAGFLDLAGLPLRGAGPGEASDRLPRNAGRIAVIRQTGTSEVEAEPLFQGDFEACQLRAIELMQRGELLVIEGFHVERITRWCGEFNYRWRFRPSRKQTSAFILEPARDPDGSVRTAPGQD
jgi:hypothetical protein